MIRKETIDKIFEIAAIEEVVGDFVNLKKRGANLLGNCPFHNEKTPSFTVSPTKGIYKCFGCGKAGNSVNFIMEHEKLTYPDALRQLAKKYNIAIEEDETISDLDREKYNHRESLMLTSDFAKKFFAETLWNTPYGQTVGLTYFKERAFREDIVKKFELGFSPQEWSGFTDAAKKEGFDERYLIETGLSIFNEEKKSVYDRFRNRVMFPIHNITGRVIASTGADVAASISGAIGAMSGPLHGGAPARVLNMIEAVEKSGDAVGYVKSILDKHERLMGFGHRVYRAEDPRARTLRRTAKELNAPRFEVALALEKAALAELKERQPDRVLETNVEFWAAIVLDFAKVPANLFTSMFTAARTAGWSAHILEQKRTGRIIRPSARYVGPGPRKPKDVKGWDESVESLHS